jgi:hypothetical protein
MTAIFAIFWLDLLLIIRCAPFLFSGETGYEDVSAGPRAGEHSTVVGVKVTEHIAGSIAHLPPSTLAGRATLIREGEARIKTRSTRQQP